MSDRRPRPSTPPRYNAVVASAAVMNGRPNPLRQSTKKEGWQDDAWAFYDTNGELRFGVGWIANGLSRLNFVAARRPILLGDEPSPLGEDSTTPIDKDAIALTSDMAGGPDGQSQMLSRLAVLLTVPGVGWVLIESETENGVSSAWAWRVVSNDELRSDR